MRTIMAAEHELREFFEWYVHHKGTIPPHDLPKRIEFLETTITNMAKVMAGMVEELQERRGSRHLWIPNGVEIRGDLSRRG
jgi:hypothetical protein